LNTKLFNTYNRPKIATNIVKSIAIDRNNNLVIGGMGGVSIINVDNKGRFKVKNYFKKNPLITYNISCVFIDSNNVIWAGSTTRGLFMFDGKGFKKANISHKDRFSKVNSILEDRREKIKVSLKILV
jgi:ligand-binding sensor domain-containing protein